MSELADTLNRFNQQLDTLLIEDEVDWVKCVTLIEQRDLWLTDQPAELTDSEFKLALEKSLELNQAVSSQMKTEQNEVEKALLKVNQGKKARASYE